MDDVEAYIGEIKMFSGTFAPRNWALCNGQLLAISQNEALFSIVGTIYGGDGRTTFGLPDLRGRSPVHSGHGPGLEPVREGQRGGSDSHEVQPANKPGQASVVRDAYCGVNFIIALEGVFPPRS